MEPPSDGIPRTVQPRDNKPPAFLPIIIVDGTEYFVERTGEVGSIADLPNLFPREPSSIVIGTNIAEMVANLNDTYGGKESWQYRVTPMRREVNRPGRDRRPAAVLDTVVNYFGFRGELRKSGKSRKPGHWFYPVDPFVFSRTGLTNVLRGDGTRPMRLFKWGRDVREFCAENNLKISPTGGGLAGQLLRDPRFYPEARRKVPRQTNATVRHHIPGNYYRLFVDTDTVFPRAAYLDMASAHHHCAATLTFPHADRLMRRGDWATTDPTDNTVPYGRPQWEPGTTAFDAMVNHAHGLLKVRLQVPAIPATMFPPPCMEKPGLRSAFVYTNELPTIRELGGVIVGIDAAWCSFQTDHGLNRYATWALTELATMDPDRKAWAKPVLLSVYGVLASKPKAMEMGHRRAKGGRITELPAGKRTLPAYLRNLGIREAPVVNVVQRGMIETETRTQCLSMAREMHRLGHSVLSIYADSVFVEASGAVPLLPPPWIVKGYLTNLMFHNSTSFTARELSKLPGIPRDGMERARRLALLRATRERRMDSVRQGE